MKYLKPPYRVNGAYLFRKDSDELDVIVILDIGIYPNNGAVAGEVAMCVNNHDALVAALKLTVGLKDKPYGDGKHDEAVEAAREALAQLEK